MNESIYPAPNNGEVEKPFEGFNVGELLLKGEDAYTAMPEAGVFAVFDGVGGEPGGARASQLAAGITKMFDFASHNNPNPNEAIEQCLRDINDAINYDVIAGKTTGLIVQIQGVGSQGAIAHYANVGDSRLYVVNKDGVATQLTT